MKKTVFSGITLAISFSMVAEWAQILLLVLGIVSAIIPVIKTIIDFCKDKATIKDLQEQLDNANDFIESLYTHTGGSENDRPNE